MAGKKEFFPGFFRITRWSQLAGEGSIVKWIILPLLLYRLDSMASKILPRTSASEMKDKEEASAEEKGSHTPNPYDLRRPATLHRLLRDDLENDGG